MLMDRSAVVVMVEDFWRAFIPPAFNGDTTAASLIVQRFQTQLDQMTAILPSDEKSPFADMVEEERERLFREYNANPAALKARLGLNDHLPPAREPARSHRSELAGVAVRAAVRATVWETVVSIFRTLRR